MSLEDLEFLFQRYSRGSVSVGDIETLTHFAKDLDLVVELGTNVGTTSIILKAVAKRVCTVDVFENIDLIDDDQQREVYAVSFIHNMHTFASISHKLKPFGVEVYQGKSYEFADKFNSESVDMVFIDADHSRLGVERDYNAWILKIKIGGYAAFHDCVIGSPVYDFWIDVLNKDDRLSMAMASEHSIAKIGKSSTVVFQRVS